MDSCLSFEITLSPYLPEISTPRTDPKTATPQEVDEATEKNAIESIKTISKRREAL